MIFAHFLVAVLLSTMVNGRKPILNDLLKKVSGEDVGRSGHEPKKVEEFTGRAMTADGQSQTVKKDDNNKNQNSRKGDDEVRALDLKLRRLDVRAIGDVEEHIVIPTELKQVIVNLHNRLRASVMPRATDMETMTWDDGVAQYAADWAQCGNLFFMHRSGANKVERYGENLYVSMSGAANMASIEEDIKYGLSAWWKEVDDYNFDDNSCEVGKVCGHYTQMAWATSNTIGCGYALNCPIEGKPQFTRSFYLVCNYSPAGNYIGEKPYGFDKPSGPAIWTFGGTSKGADCMFPFMYEGASHNQCFEVYGWEMPWCKTNNGKWGYCAPDDKLAQGPCRDTQFYCPSIKSAMKGQCPSSTYYSAYLTYMTDMCSATCDYCKCPVEECHNGGSLQACACKCAGAWTGGDCRVCPLSACKNYGVIDQAACSCRCPVGYGGADCGCVNNPDEFDNHGYPFKCEYEWIEENGLCTCPYWGPTLRENCPVTCETCPGSAVQGRE